jgi:hypothetical protein
MRKMPLSQQSSKASDVDDTSRSPWLARGRVLLYWAHTLYTVVTVDCKGWQIIVFSTNQHVHDKGRYRAWNPGRDSSLI